MIIIVLGALFDRRGKLFPPQDRRGPPSSASQGWVTTLCLPSCEFFLLHFIILRTPYSRNFIPRTVRTIEI